MKESSEAQKRQCLRIFDLAEYRPVFSDIAISLFQRIVHLIVNKIKPMIGACRLLWFDRIQTSKALFKASLPLWQMCNYLALL